MTWFHYLKHSQNITKGASKAGVRFVFIPTRHKRYTLLKAPMAHKTNSKEQFVFRFFNFYVQVRTFLKVNSLKHSFDQTLLMMLLVKATFPVFETNLLLLKSYSISLTTRGGCFFNYSRMIGQQWCGLTLTLIYLFCSLTLLHRFERLITFLLYSTFVQSSQLPFILLQISRILFLTRRLKIHLRLTSSLARI